MSGVLARCWTAAACSAFAALQCQGHSPGAQLLSVHAEPMRAPVCARLNPSTLGNCLPPFSPFFLPDLTMCVAQPSPDILSGCFNPAPAAQACPNTKLNPEQALRLQHECLAEACAAAAAKEAKSKGGVKSVVRGAMSAAAFAKVRVTTPVAPKTVRYCVSLPLWLLRQSARWGICVSY